MNNFLKILAVLMLLMVSSTACRHKRDYKAEAEKLHKKHPASPLLKSLKTYSSITDSAHPNPVEMLVQDEAYDNKGRRIKLIHYTDSGKIEFTTNYTYDDKGNIIQTHNIFPGDSSETTQKNTYDKDNHLVKTDWTSSKGSYGKNEFQYDKYGKMERMDAYEKGKFVITRLYPFVYDEDGRPLEGFDKETSNNKDTSVQGHRKYTYDSLTGFESGEFVMYGDVPIEIVESHYDKNRDKIMEIHYQSDSTGQLSPHTRIMNVFNEFGEITETQVYKDKMLESTTTNTYDTYGHLVATETREGDSIKKTRYEYTYQK
jgi:hypothetical protein